MGNNQTTTNVKTDQLAALVKKAQQIDAMTGENTDLIAEVEKLKALCGAKDKALRRASAASSHNGDVVKLIALSQKALHLALKFRSQGYRGHSFVDHKTGELRNLGAACPLSAQLMAVIVGEIRTSKSNGHKSAAAPASVSVDALTNADKLKALKSEGYSVASLSGIHHASKAYSVKLDALYQKHIKGTATPTTTAKTVESVVFDLSDFLN